MSVVILTITHKPTLSNYETISIKQCTKVLGRYERYFVCPKGMDIAYYQSQFPDWKFYFVHPYWLSTYARSNRLKITPKLFKAFEQFEFILFHEPDAFVFQDELEYWMQQDYSYIGAPWFEGYEGAGNEQKYTGVGNSGFSLRKVSDHLKALRSWKSLYKWKDYDKYLAGGKNKYFQTLKFFFRMLFGNTTRYPFHYFWNNEDIFWGIHVSRNYDWFKLPTIMTARKFSFEVAPARMYKDNNNQLPFGCHAWMRYDIEFWQPFIESYDYQVTKEEIATE